MRVGWARARARPRRPSSRAGRLLHPARGVLWQFYGHARLGVYLGPTGRFVNISLGKWWAKVTRSVA